MNVMELRAELDKWPADYEVMVDCQPIQKVACIEGRTSDGPGTINLEGDGA